MLVALAAGSGSHLSASELPGGGDHELWSSLGGAANLIAATNVQADNFWDYLCLVNHAVDSQYDLLCNLPGNSPLEASNIACLAVAGDGFHGQHGRPWRTEPGNLHLSVRMPVDLPTVQVAPAMMMLPAVALIRTLDDLGGPGPSAGIKWVNDILLNGHKVGGVLTYARSCQNRLAAVTFGLGLNLVSAPALPPTPLTRGATCLLADWGSAAGGLAVVLPRLLDHLAQLMNQVKTEGPADVISAYRERSLVLGRQVGIWLEEADSQLDDQPDLTGRVTAVEDDLSLRLQGHRAPVTSGRLALLA